MAIPSTRGRLPPRISVGLGLREVIAVFEEQEPGSLLGVVELGGAAGLFPEDVVDVLEGLFEHREPSLLAATE